MDIYPLGRLPADPRRWTSPGSRRLLVEKIPFLLVSVAAAVTAFAALRHGGQMASLEKLGLVERLALSLHSVAFYLWKTAVPIGLSPLYEVHLPVNVLGKRFVASAAAVLALATAAAVMRHRWPGLPAAAAAYAIALVPVSGVFQNGPQLAADRYTYLACIGWGIVAAGLMVRPWPWGWSRPVLRYGLCVAAAGVLVALGALTRTQAAVWTDSVTLWSHALAMEPSSTTATKNLGYALVGLGRTSEAYAHFERVSRNAPTAARLFAFGWALDRSGDSGGAERYYREALELDPHHRKALNNLGVIHAGRGEFTKALELFSRLLAADPNDAAACSNARQAAMRLGVRHPAVLSCPD
jgi:tetratricopeptide (TPR) repeat protein